MGGGRYTPSPYVLNLKMETWHEVETCSSNVPWYMMAITYICAEDATGFVLFKMFRRKFSALGQSFLKTSESTLESQKYSSLFPVFPSFAKAWSSSFYKYPWMVAWVNHPKRVFSISMFRGSFLFSNLWSRLLKHLVFILFFLWK